MNPYILELKYDSSNFNETPSDFTVNLSKPLVVNEGDVISLKMASIDSQVSDAGTVVIPETVNLSMNFSYYEYDIPEFDPSDNYTKLKNVDDSSHNATYKFNAAYTQNIKYEFEKLVYTCDSFIPVTKGSIFFKAGAKNTSIDKASNVRGTFSYTEPFKTDRVFSTFNLGDFSGKLGEVKKGDFDGAEGAGGLFKDDTKPTSHTFKPPNPNLLFEGVFNQQGNAPDNGDFFRRINVTCTIRFYDEEGEEVTATATKSTNINQKQEFGKLVTFLPGDFIVNGEPWNGIHLGTQFFEKQTSTFEEFVGGTLFKPIGDDTKNVHLTENKANENPSTTDGTDLIVNRINVQIPEGRYEPDSLAKFITRGYASMEIKNELGDIKLRFPSNRLLTRLDVIKGDRVLFKNLSEPLNNGEVDFKTDNVYYYSEDFTKRTLGASIFDMGFNVQGNGSYSINYAHTPLYNPDEDDTQNVAFFQDSNNNVFGIPTNSGIVVHDLQPRQFWNDVLGFNESNFIVPIKRDVNGIKYYDVSGALQKIPQGAITLDMFTSPLYTRSVPEEIDPNPTFFQTTETKSVVGELPLPSNVGGYYKLEITGLGLNNNFVDETTITPSILAIISTQYDSNSFVTGFSDQGISYRHTGSSYVISKLNVKIKNPDDTLVRTLGDKTSIFITINRAEINLQKEK